ncbi:MAG: hypothetical protein Q9188_003396 [Gyalolechia gomerana]
MQPLLVNLAAACLVFDVAAAFIIRDMRNSAKKERAKNTQIAKDKETSTQKYISKAPKKKYVMETPKLKYTSENKDPSKRKKATTTASHVGGPSKKNGGKASPFKLGYEEVRGNWDHEGRHWEMGQALGISDFEDYWAYLVGGRRSSKAEKHVRFETPYSMAVTPIVDDSGTPTHLVVNNIYYCDKHGAMTMEYTYSLPEEKYRESITEWKKQLVTIMKQTGDSMTVTTEELVETEGMAPEQMMAVLNRWIRKAPFNKVYSDARK